MKPVDAEVPHAPWVLHTAWARSLGHVKRALDRVPWPWIVLLLWLCGAVCALAVTGQWFSPGRFLAGGDIFPTTFINPGLWAHRMLYAWSATTTQGGPSDYIKNFPQIGLNWLLRLFLPAPETQHAFYAVLLGAQFLAMVFFSLTVFPEHRLAALLAAIFYCLNPFMVLQATNYISLFFWAFVPFIVALFVRIVTGTPNRLCILLFAIASATAGFLFNNPTVFVMFVAFFLFIAASTLWTYRAQLAGIWRRFTVCVVLAVLVNVYWAVPSYFTVFGIHQQSVGGTVMNASTALSWAWTAQRDSILNMFWLNPVWSWSHYFPYASIYNSPLLSIIVYVPTLLAFSVLLNRGINRALALVATSLALVLLLLATGLHAPWQSINRFLFQHVPLFWLFREPDTKFTLLLIILYAPLIGYQGEWLANGTAHLLRRWGREWVAMLARLCVLAPLGLAMVVSAFPVVTGAVTGRGYTPPNKLGTKIPAYWYRLGAYLSSHDSTAGVLLLPSDDFYQMRYTWNYYGADRVAEELLPNPTTWPTDTESRMIQDDSPQSLAPYLALQHVRYIVQRNDIVTTVPGRLILSPPHIRAYLHHQRDVHFVRSFGQLDLYEMDRRAYLPPVYAVSLPRRDLSGAQRGRWIDQGTTAALELLPVGPVPRAGQLAATRRPRVIRLAWSQTNITRLSVRVPATTGPVLLVLSVGYHPSWHACIMTGGAAVPPWACWFGGFIPARDHLPVLGLYNGWVLDHPGRYTVILDYGFQHIAVMAAVVSALAVAGIVVWSIGPPLLRLGQRVHGLTRARRPEI